jgi:ribonucleoside-triphosphate reductase
MVGGSFIMLKEKRTLQEVETELALAKEALSHVHGSETEVYARIVGYYRSVRNWNKGKKDEYNHRKQFVINSGIEKTTDSIPSSKDEKATDILEPDLFGMISSTIKPYSFSSTKDIHYHFYARKTCPNCPSVKEYLIESDLEGSLIDVDTQEGLKDAAEKGVFAAPTVIIYNKAEVEIARAHSVEELVSLLQPAAHIA